MFLVWNEVNADTRREAEEPTPWLRGKVLCMEKICRGWWNNKKGGGGGRNYSGMGMEQLWVCTKGKAKYIDKCNFKFFA